MKVKELIELLDQLDEDAPVLLRSSINGLYHKATPRKLYVTPFSGEQGVYSSKDGPPLVPALLVE